MALSCIISEDKDIRKYAIFIPHEHAMPPRGGPRRNIATRFGTEQTIMVRLSGDINKMMMQCLDVSTRHRLVTDRETDRRTDRSRHVVRQHAYIALRICIAR